MTTGEKIRKYRLERGLSQKELGLRAGMSEPAVRNYELGNRIPSVKRLEALAGALGVSRFALSDPDLDTYIGVDVYKRQTMWYAPTLTIRSGRICAAKCSGWCCRTNKIQRDKTLKWGGGYDTIQIL